MPRFDMSFGKGVLCSIVLVAFCLLVLNTSPPTWRHTNPLLNYITTNKENDDHQIFNLDFIPKGIKTCDDLISSSSSPPSAQPYNMSSYYFRLKEFEEAAAARHRSTGSKHLEGHSGSFKEQTMVLHRLAAHPFVRTVCETGFNMGHSSFNYLTANPRASVYSFDLGSHEYSLAMSDYLRAQFPGRFSIRFGSSTDTIPKFIEENPDVRCDVILVDGGHNYEVAYSDLLNFARMADLERNVIIFDDYPTDWGQDFGQAWMDAVKKGIAEELMRFSCSNQNRGFLIGRYVKRP